MDTHTNDANWLYLFINNSENKESFAGFHDEELDIRFLPVFHEKESALICSGRFMKGEKPYEVQAIHSDDLNSYAAQNDFLIFILDKTGAILEKKVPTQA